MKKRWNNTSRTRLTANTQKKLTMLIKLGPMADRHSYVKRERAGRDETNVQRQPEQDMTSTVWKRKILLCYRTSRGRRKGCRVSSCYYKKDEREYHKGV